jgi:hypothetical protein
MNHSILMTRYESMRTRLVRQGWLFKQGHKFKNWRRRWFVLLGFKLLYYKKAPATLPSAALATPPVEGDVATMPATPMGSSIGGGRPVSTASTASTVVLSRSGGDLDTAPAGSLDLRDYTLEEAVLKQSSLALRLVSRRALNDELLMYAETNEEFVGWVKALSSVIAQAEDLQLALLSLEATGSAGDLSAGSLTPYGGLYSGLNETPGTLPAGAGTSMPISGATAASRTPAVRRSLLGARLF